VRVATFLMTGLIGCGTLMVGCRDNSPPPERVPVPASADREPITHRDDGMKPLPPPRVADTVPPPPFNDVPLVDQQPPEQPAFVDAYHRVGSPRIVLFINRTLQGDVIPVNPHEPLVSVEQSQKSTGSVTVENRESYDRDSRWHDQSSEQSDRFQSNGPAEYRERTDVYLHPGQYDEVSAKSLDYEAIENIMTDWLAANGQVTIISPIMARQQLSDQQVKEIQEGRPQAMSEAVHQLGADIFVQVQAHPTRQTARGLEVRIIAEAINVKGGESIARAVVDVPPPLEKTTINKYTRFLSRKLMDGMIGSWLAPPPPAAPENQTSPPSSAAPPAPAPSAPPSTAPSANTTFSP
jgi:hypothetical protein